MNLCSRIPVASNIEVVGYKLPHQQAAQYVLFLSGRDVFVCIPFVIETQQCYCQLLVTRGICRGWEKWSNVVPFFGCTNKRLCYIREASGWCVHWRCQDGWCRSNKDTQSKLLTCRPPSWSPSCIRKLTSIAPHSQQNRAAHERQNLLFHNRCTPPAMETWLMRPDCSSTLQLRNSLVCETTIYVGCLWSAVFSIPAGSNHFKSRIYPCR